MSFWRPWRLTAAVALALAAAPAAATLAETVVVPVDQARVLRLPSDTATVVIGNPLIADVSLQSGGMLVLTGKGYGRTNLLALDRDGSVTMDVAVQVEAPRSSDLVVVYRGTERESYSCAPGCSRRFTLGDAPDYFDLTQKQITSRFGQATAVAPGSH